jgi:transcriptional regulator PpsR
MLSSEQQLIQPPSCFRLPKESIGNLDAETAASIVAASSDVAMVIDRDGVIKDISVSTVTLPSEVFAGMLDRRWVDTVTSDSRLKVEELLRDATVKSETSWREINQRSGQGSIAVRFRTVSAGRDGKVVALGRDLSADHSMQQRILQAQQAMERDYVRLRQAESRHRVLFQMASEAVLIVDPASRKIVEANPAAASLLNLDNASLPGQAITKLFHAESRDAVLGLMSDQTVGRSEAIEVRLADGREGIRASASLFRQDGSVHALISLSSALPDAPLSEDEAKQRLVRVLNRIPEAFVVTDANLNILDANLAFLEMAQIPTAEAAKGELLSRFIGRPGIDFKVLLRNLREHGWVRNFNTLAFTAHGHQEDVELSAVAVTNGGEETLGFVIRPSRRSAVGVTAAPTSQLPRTAEELTQLVGSLSLREIVAETTDVIERMCIKAALNLTGNNRASAAEVLGLSRQSLYSKLNRHGLTGDDLDDPIGN